jgi:predicted acylesterase/phospholipase RssA
LYLIRSYDHDERTTPDPSRGTTRRSTRRTTRSSTGRSRDTPAGDYSTARRNRNVNYGNAQAFQIWEVARAATAAPFYFEPLRIDTPGLSGDHLLFTDGGFNYTNNPTIEGTREIEDLYGSNSIGIVVSVGTARKDVPTNGGGIIGKMKGIANTAANPEPVHSDMLEKSRKEKFHYCRLNDLDRLNVDLDEWKPRRKLFTNQSGQKTLADIKAAFADWAMEVKTVQMLKTCAEELVVRRRARTEDAAKWERYAIGAQFRCQFKGCEREDFVSRSEFESHLRMDHHMPQAELQGEADSCRKYWRYQRADRR